jgi:bleomycin hydrolase
MINPETALQEFQVDELRKGFDKDAQARLMQNAVTTTPIDQIALDRRIVTSIDTSFSNQLDTWKVANQKKSGRCWLFAGLNLLRSHVINELKLDNFEFSQAYLHFYDKLEKANWFFASMIEMAERPLDDRTVHQLLSDPIGDGGQWDMFVSLVQKYGVVPKFAMPESESSSNTSKMNTTLETLLRKGARDLRKVVQSGADDKAVQHERAKLVNEVYRVLSIHLGTPPTEFLWQWKDKEGNFHRRGTVTPQEFAREYLGINLDEYVCVVNDPRNEYNTTLTVDHLGNVVGGRAIKYLNVDADTIRDLVKTSLLDNRPVWFGCDVGKQFDRTTGYWDEHLFDYNNVYGVDLTMTKAEQMEYGESAMTHAMVFTGIDLVDEKPRRYRVENSWGDERSDKGFDTMNDSWFGEHVFEVAVRIADLPYGLEDQLKLEPKVLPLWDPMGSLA